MPQLYVLLLIGTVAGADPRMQLWFPAYLNLSPPWVSFVKSCRCANVQIIGPPRKDGMTFRRSPR